MFTVIPRSNVDGALNGTTVFGCIQDARTQRFTVQPVSVMQAEGLETIFECLYPGALSHSWGINGMYPADDAFPPDVTRTLPSGDTPATLAIPATDQYNNTVVQCRAVLIVERNMQIVPTCDVLLLVQGRLGSVTGLRLNMVTSTSMTLIWDAPFSLDLTTAEPDIQYCVDVHSVPGGQLVESTCDIIDTNYTFSTSDQDQLMFTVTPRSNVEGSLNGTSSELVGPPLQGNGTITDGTPSPSLPTIESAQPPFITIVVSSGVTAVVVLLLLLVIAILTAIVIVKRKQRNHKDGRVDLSSTLPGIEQPNEAHAPVLNKNIAYEQTRIPRHNEHTTTIVTTVVATEDENIEPSHDYEEILL
ncbi:uncharacterized protein LOC135336525 [Halichondria panicea]|uniref:uncharacterized protein LOC135336525 n=1 Tax=Halichondria panicea TaxID=6063 RepID=UPI00312BC1A7